MKKNVVIFGLISGLIITAMMIGSTVACYRNENFEGNMVAGYAAMIIAFSFIFIGIRNFRDRYNAGLITFGKAFKIGLYITLIASTIYLLVWLVEYYLFIPDFMEKYIAHVMREAEASGASQAELDKKAAQMDSYKEMYKNPLFVVIFTYLEVFPIGLVISLISALILKRKSGAAVAN
ncbi:MAG TPA: DUF4199 domain-containing protein [Anseongella sp.]|nr:DUF4199 domain-containing protein [Anseongella sp.]